MSLFAEGWNVPAFKTSHRYKLAQVKAYGQLSPPFFISSGVRQDCHIEPFLLTFGIRYAPQKSLSDLLSGTAELLPGNTNFI